MSYLQPTVRQLQPLGRRQYSAPIVPEEVDAHAHAADAASPNTQTSASPVRRWWHRLPARATLTS